MLPDLEYAAIRYENFLEEVLRPLATPRSHPLDVAIFQTSERIGFSETREAAFDPVGIGYRWGPVWSTAWFRLTGRIPEDFSGCRVGLRFSSGTEALLWRDQVPFQGFDANRDIARLYETATGGLPVEFLIEAACNMPLGISTFWWDHPELHARWKEECPGRLESAELVEIDEVAWQFCEAWDLARRLFATLPKDSPRAVRIEQGLRMLHQRIPAKSPRDAMGELLPELNALLVGEGSHGRTTCLAVGHAHIDTAWLWPIAETRRKCTRTFATALRLMERFPAFRFIASQAQQYAWIREDAPELFEQIAARVADGSWEAGGAMWIEPDCNIPDGESLIRQVLHGCGWWSEHFGDAATQHHVYLPDTFGFPASLPQIIRGSGIETFITNKISWCERNRFPHVSFDWVGIDGSRVLTHLTPGHNYNSSILPADLDFAEKNIVELDHCQTSAWLQPFGFGDGGGGPTAEQIQRVEYMANVEGLPAVKSSRVDAFCEVLHRQRELHLATGRPFHEWSGELYLELHRGTYTSQRWLKQANHDAERDLRSIELLAATHASVTSSDLSALRSRIDATWKLVLLNQFHDILPGSSIQEVYADARSQYEAIEQTCQEELNNALAGHASDLDIEGFDQPVMVFNPASSARGGLVDVDGELLLVDEVPACGVALADLAHLKPAGDVVVEELSIRNEHISVRFDESGRITELCLAGQPHTVNGSHADGTPCLLNEFVMYEDRPRRWEAWDIDRDYMEKSHAIGTPAQRIATIEAGPLRGAIEFEHELGVASRLVVRYHLDTGARRLDVDVLVDWREEQSLLRAEFQTDVRAQHARSGIQFGSIERPTHRNTSWEEARFEVPGHRWMDLSEPGRGLAVLDTGIIGRSFHGSRMGLSLLRATNFPDPEADRGEHRFRYALFPHEGDWRRAGVEKEAEALNRPLVVHQITQGGGANSSHDVGVAIESDANLCVEVAAFKPAEDDASAVLRLVETHGAHGHVRVHLPGYAHAEPVNLREQPMDASGFAWDSASSIASFHLRPFEIASIRVRPQEA